MSRIFEHLLSQILGIRNENVGNLPVAISHGLKTRLHETRIRRQIKSIDASDDPDERLQIAVDAAVRQISRLIDGGAPGVHLYTLNQGAATIQICEQLAAL